MGQTRTGSPADRAGTFAPFASTLALEWIAHRPDDRTRIVPGTLAFFDISGFTRLSERLAGAGKVGTETITGIVDAIFSRLIEDVFAHAGDVLEFSGDAILVLFPGSGAEHRGAAAALAMQRTIDEIGRIATDRGDVRLRMSVGVHTGEIHFALLGENQQTILAFGPDATRTCRMEKAARAGEVLVSPELASALGPRDLRRRTDGELVLRRGSITEMHDTVGARLAAPTLGAVRLVPTPLRATLEESAVPGEHRPLALGFVGVRELDPLLDRLGTEETAERLGRVAIALEEAHNAYGITWLGVDTLANGCDFFLCSGAPVVHEDDEDRLLLALRHVLDADTGLVLAAGANRGRAFTAVIGHDRRKTYSVTGDATNLAARVMAHAEPGQLLATTTMLVHARRAFDVAPVTPFVAKGKRAPVETSDVRAASADPSAGSEVTLAFVGRDHELALLTDALAEARDGRGQAIEIVAEPGMGKSRLVTELQALAKDTRILVTSADPYARSRPYFAWRALLRGLADIAPDAPPEIAGARLTEWTTERAPGLAPWLPLVAIPIDAAVPPTPEVERLDARYVQDRAHSAVGDLLSEVLTDPTLLVIEDSHWLDDASRELLARVADVARHRPWLIVVTHRPDAGTLGLESVRTITLRPLAADSAETLALAAAGDAPLARAALTRLVAQAGGNPLFVRELVAVAESDGELPESVERVIGARVDALPAGPRTLLREAAVLGARADLAVLSAALRDAAVVNPSTWQPLAAFVEEDDGMVRFRHDLFRLVAYEGLPYRRRRELHGRIGDVLARTAAPDLADELAPELALHFSRAHRYDAAWQWCTRAAERARRQAALVDALELYRQALDAARHLPALDPHAVGVIAEAMGDVGEHAGRLDDAHAGYRAARRLSPGEPVVQGRLLRKEGYIAEKGGDYVGSLRWYRRALAVLEPAGDAAGERTHAALGYAATRIHQGKLADARRWIERGLSDAEARDDTDALAQAFMLLEIIAAETGDPRRMEYEERALGLTRELGDERRFGSLLLNLGLSAANESRWDDAAVHYAEAELRFHAVGHVVGSALVANNRAEVLTDQGRYEEARPLLEESRRAFRAARYEVGVAITTSGLSRLDVRAGRFAEAHAGLDDADARFRRLRAGLYVADTLVRQVECLVCEGRPEEALTAADAAAKELAAVGSGTMLPITLARLRACALAQQGREADARAEIDRALVHARDDHVDYEIAACLDALVAITGNADPELTAERDRIVHRLGVVALPEIPL